MSDALGMAVKPPPAMGWDSPAPSVAPPVPFTRRGSLEKPRGGTSRMDECGLSSPLHSSSPMRPRRGSLELPIGAGPTGGGWDPPNPSSSPRTRPPRWNTLDLPAGVWAGPSPQGGAAAAGGGYDPRQQYRSPHPRGPMRGSLDLPAPAGAGGGGYGTASGPFSGGTGTAGAAGGRISGGGSGGQGPMRASLDLSALAGARGGYGTAGGPLSGGTGAAGGRISGGGAGGQGPMRASLNLSALAGAGAGYGYASGPLSGATGTTGAAGGRISGGGAGGQGTMQASLDMSAQAGAGAVGDDARRLSLDYSSDRPRNRRESESSNANVTHTGARISGGGSQFCKPRKYLPQIRTSCPSPTTHCHSHTATRRESTSDYLPTTSDRRKSVSGPYQPIPNRLGETSSTGGFAQFKGLPHLASHSPQPPPVSRPLGKPRTRRQSLPDYSGDGLGDESGDALAYDEMLVQKLKSLPEMVCRTAGGEILIMELGKVKKSVHLQRIGQEGLTMLNRFENVVQSQWDRDQCRTATVQDLISDLRHEELHCGLSTVGDTREIPTPMSKTNRLGLKKSQSIAPGVPETGIVEDQSQVADLDEDIQNHVDKTMACVEAHRTVLIEHNKLQSTAGQKALKEAQEAKQQAIDFLAYHFVPKRLMEMVLAAHPNPEAKEEAQASALGHATEEGEGAASRGGMPMGEAERKKALIRRKSVIWQRVGGHIADTRRELDSLPFMSRWTQETKRLTAHNQLSKEGWDSLFGQEGAYVKGDNTQGGAVYTLKCTSLGVHASSQVLNALKMENANMAHCKLGRYGAAALRHALAANNVITALNLEDNGLCGKAVQDIVEGITAGGITHIVEKPPAPLNDKSKTKTNGQVPIFSTDIQHSRADTSLIPKHLPNGMSTPGLRSGPSFKPSSSSLDFLRSRVKLLDLTNNLLGLKGAKAAADMLDPVRNNLQLLTEIRLKKCGIPEEGGVALASALMNGNYVLTHVNLANNSLGNKAATRLGNMLSENSTLAFLDLSWNLIKAEGAQGLQEGLEVNTGLTSLNLSWNGLENEGGVFMGLAIKANQSLKLLDLSHTRISSRGCLTIAEGLRENTTLESLLLNGNLLGDDGGRHLMSAVKANTSLIYLGLQGSNMSSVGRDNSDNSGAAKYNPLSPDGSYMLDLSNTTQRSVALSLCAKDASSTGNLMQNIKLEGRNLKSCKAAKWPVSLPTSGLLQFDFVSWREKNVMTVMTDQKLDAVQSQFVNGKMPDREKLSVIEMMAPFSYLTCKQIAQLLDCFQTGGDKVTAAELLFTRACDLELNAQQISLAVKGRDSLMLQRSLGWFLYLRFSNPNGHYELDLSFPPHHALANRLKDVAQTESNMSWLNIGYDTYTRVQLFPDSYGTPQVWSDVVPTAGLLSFDYKTHCLAPPGTEPISDELLVELLVNEFGIEFDEDSGALLPACDFDMADHQLSQMRLAAVDGGHIAITCSQLVGVVNCFKASPHRVEVVVLFHPLIVDRVPNFWKVVYDLRAIEQALLMWRLGPINVFDKNHPSGHYVLDLNQPLHEMVARKLVDLAAANHEFANVWNLRLNGRHKNVTENNMWGMLTAESFTPFIEIDFVGTDVFEALLGKNSQEAAALSKHVKGDLVKGVGKKMEFQRIKALYPYYEDGSGYERLVWQSAAQEAKAQSSKQPWLASWDRMVRMLQKQEEHGNILIKRSYMEDLFIAAGNGSGLPLTAEQFEAMVKAHTGASKHEITHYYRESFEASSHAAVTRSALPPPEDGERGLRGRGSKNSSSGSLSSLVPPSAAMADTIPDPGITSSGSGSACPNPLPPLHPPPCPVSAVEGALPNALKPSRTARFSDHSGQGPPASGPPPRVRDPPLAPSPTPFDPFKMKMLSKRMLSRVRTRTSTSGDPDSDQVLDFDAFVSIMMQEPSKDLRAWGRSPLVVNKCGELDRGDLPPPC